MKGGSSAAARADPHPSKGSWKALAACHAVLLQGNGGSPPGTPRQRLGLAAAWGSSSLKRADSLHKGCREVLHQAHQDADALRSQLAGAGRLVACLGCCRAAWAAQCRGSLCLSRQCHPWAAEPGAAHLTPV